MPHDPTIPQYVPDALANSFYNCSEDYKRLKTQTPSCVPLSNKLHHSWYMERSP